jgi:Ca-activated chloride channel family protein
MLRAGICALSAAMTMTIAAGAQRPTFRAGVDLVNFGVTVVDKQGNPVSGLRADDFEIVENGRRQSLQYFAEGEPELAPPLHLGLLLDTSGSMSDDITAARKAAVKFVNSTDRAADVTLVDFATEVSVARFNPDDYPRLVERIRMGKVDGMTALYDALGMYLNTADGQDGQKVLVLYTDGGDTRSSLTYQDVLDLVKASDVTIYAVGYLQHETSSAGLQQRQYLQRFADLTGGQAYFPLGPRDLDGVFEKIQKEIAARYSLGYVSSDTRADGAWRSVAIKLLRRDLKGVRLRTRSGYFAPYKAKADK